MQLPASVGPSIQIVPLTRGSVVLTEQHAYACTNAHDILSTVAQLLPPDGSIGATPGPQVVPEAPQQAPAPSGEANPLIQQENLLRLCDGWARGLVSDQQFDDLVAQVCPDIGLEEAYLTRDSFAPRDDGQSQIGELLDDTA